jgi:hypothetical protein
MPYISEEKSCLEIIFLSDEVSEMLDLLLMYNG